MKKQEEMTQSKEQNKFQKISHQLSQQTLLNQTINHQFPQQLLLHQKPSMSLPKETKSLLLHKYNPLRLATLLIFLTTLLINQAPTNKKLLPMPHPKNPGVHSRISQPLQTTQLVVVATKLPFIFPHQRNQLPLTLDWLSLLLLLTPMLLPLPPVNLLLQIILH